jgi:hypothetical protein
MNNKEQQFLSNLDRRSARLKAEIRKHLAGWVMRFDLATCMERCRFLCICAVTCIGNGVFCTVLTL